MLEQTAKRPADALRDSEWTKGRLLAAAFAEFSEHGLSGARVNAIASRAGVNKQLVYYYFGDKDGLYAAVLERAYSDIRSGETELDLATLPPLEAMRRFIEYTFDYLVAHPNFVLLLNDENIHKARHLKGSAMLRGLHASLKRTLGDIVTRGMDDGVFKRSVDPVDLYITIASLCYFYHSNNHTLSAIFRRDLSSRTQTRRRRRHITEIVLVYLTTPHVGLTHSGNRS